jgi:hypothetical protein
MLGQTIAVSPPTLNSNQNPTEKLYLELGVAAAILIFLPGYWKILAAVPLFFAVGSQAGLA